MATTTTAQNEPDTTAPGAPLTALPTDQISYEDLYARWERGNWRASEIDFTEDARQWREGPPPLSQAAAPGDVPLFSLGGEAPLPHPPPQPLAAPPRRQKSHLTT